MDATVEMSEVGERGVLGGFARPAGPGPWPAVVAFGGSSGGLGPAAGWAPALAAQGFAVLAVAYFGAPGLSPILAEIEVEVVERAVSWLVDQGHVAGDAIAAMGISRGSELALLASIHVDQVGPVVGLSPSGIAWAALGPAGPMDASPWTVGGVPVPYAQTSGELLDREGPIVLRTMFDEALADESAWRHAEIEVERAKGPILLVSGEDDAMWPSTPLAEGIERRAAAHGFTHPVTHLRYTGAGHAGAGVPDLPGETEVLHPLTGQTYVLGGTREANGAARADSWPRIVEFLRSSLRA